MNLSLRSALKRARRKIQLENFLKGIALLLGFLLIASLIFTYVLAKENFSETALFWSRLIGLGGAIALLVYYVVRPLFRAPSKTRIARFLEERHPELEERLSTAIEIDSETSSVHPEVRALVSRDAFGKLNRIRRPHFYFPQRSTASLLAVGVCVLIFALLSLIGPAVYPYSLNKLLRDWYDRAQPPLYSIEVSPGTVTVGKRSDVEIRARLEGFDSEKVQLVARYENEPDWEETSMRVDPEGNGFMFRFFDVRDRIDYYVTADGIQSPVFVINVSEIPRVQELRVQLFFPRYTGLESVTQEQDGNIRALIGTVAEFSIQADQPVKAGKLKLENGGEVALEMAEPRELRGKIEVSKDDYYRIHLQDSQDFWNPASEEFIIEALQDQPPNVRFTRPGRDQRVSNIEEVFTELKAEDDYGVARVRLRYSVNGGPEEEASLNYRRGARSFSSSHTFYLEEFGLQPGDFVSYYAQASDAVSTTSTDMYFLEVEPFDREYYQAQQAGGMPAGGPRDQTMLSRRQKEIIAATFNLQRDRRRYSNSEFTENSQTLALVQQRLQGEAQTIVDRIERRGAAASDPRFRKMAEHLKEAITFMEPAHKYLNQLELESALPEEQKSYQQLLRAEALLKEIQVSFSQSGGGGAASAEELADMVDLELDRTKNQYETLQQNRELNREESLDEALEKLKELATRQQQMVERQRQQAMQGGSSSNMSQQELIEEAERLARELDRLSRQEPDPQLDQISRQLKQAARDMRQAQSQGQNDQEAQMRAQQALDRLQQAQQSLAQHRQEQMSTDLQQLKETSERLVREQEQVLEKIDQLDKAIKEGRLDQNFMRDIRNTLRDKARLQQDLQQLEGELHQSARQLANEQQNASRKLKEAALNVRDQRIPEKMQEGSRLLGRGETDMAKAREEGVARDLQELAEKVREAESALGQTNQATEREKLQQALSEVGSLVENLESLHSRSEKRRSRQGQEEDPRSPGERQENPEQSSESSQQAGEQPGQQPGRQGQGQQQSQSGQESEGQQASGSQGTERGGQEGSAEGAEGGTYWGGPASNTGLNPRQIRREWQERLREGAELAELLGQRPELSRNLSDVLRRMRQIDMERLFSDPEELARLKGQVIDGFRQLELEINRALTEEAESLLRLVNEDEVPPEFRTRVEEYYRNLSRQRND